MVIFVHAYKSGMMAMMNRLSGFNFICCGIILYP